MSQNPDDRRTTSAGTKSTAPGATLDPDAAPGFDSPPDDQASGLLSNQEVQHTTHEPLEFPPGSRKDRPRRR